MFPNATVSSRSSSSRSAHSCSRNSSMPSLRMRNPLSPKTSFNPLFRHSDAFTSFDAANFVFQDSKREKPARKPVLRRYNSHDSHSNFIESSTNTPESTKSRTSIATESSAADSTDRKRTQEYEARDFLERYSLPRVVRVEDGEPLLLYRCFDSFTKVQARGVIGRKGKEKIDTNLLHFPEGYSGWFSLTNEKGEKCAVAHTSVLQLVREQVCSFISIQPFNAYTAQNGTADVPGKVQYLKTQVQRGQLFQLRAVFQHKDRPETTSRNSTRSSRISRNARDKDLANRYAQLISQNHQEFYVPLTTKGEFYETHTSIKARLCFPGLLDKTGPLALDRDCLYKLTHLLRRVALPVKVKLMSGPLPQDLPKDYTDTFVLEKKFQEPLMVTCTLPPPTESTHKISCININSGVKLSKCTLGFDSENRLFKSQRLQAALSFCHKNVENWYREVRLVPKFDGKPCANCRKLKCEGRCRQTTTAERQIITREALDKFPKPKKWYKHLKILNANAEDKFEEPIEGVEKVKSIERYKDMSKLIEDKFGKKTHNPVKKSASFMFSTKRIDLVETPSNEKTNAALLKCQSLDTQIYSEENRRTKHDWTTATSNISDLSYDFQMCILENETEPEPPTTKTHFLKANKNSLRETKPPNFQITEIEAWDEIKHVDEPPKLKKNKPDLIPTLPKESPAEKSYISDRLCSEFHVKTKVQKKIINKPDGKVRTSGRFQAKNISVFEVVEEPIAKIPVIVEVHETKPNRKIPEDIPYSNVADEVCASPAGRDENIYAEICEAGCKCENNKLCACKRTKTDAEYCYVKLGSNGESITQSDSDEAIYNTLR